MSDLFWVIFQFWHWIAILSMKDYYTGRDIDSNIIFITGLTTIFVLWRMIAHIGVIKYPILLKENMHLTPANTPRKHLFNIKNTPKPMKMILWNSKTSGLVPVCLSNIQFCSYKWNKFEFSLQKKLTNTLFIYFSKLLNCPGVERIYLHV